MNNTPQPYDPQPRPNCRVCSEIHEKPTPHPNPEPSTCPRCGGEVLLSGKLTNHRPHCPEEQIKAFQAYRQGKPASRDITEPHQLPDTPAPDVKLPTEKPTVRNGETNEVSVIGASSAEKPKVSDFETILEMVWLDGAQLAGGAYLGKRTMTVSEALAAHTRAVEEAVREADALLKEVNELLTNYRVYSDGEDEDNNDDVIEMQKRIGKYLTRPQQEQNHE